MASVVVIGGGFGGLATAARLAKLGHEVTVLERSSSIGGALGQVESEGFSWDSGPSTTLLPAVIRDLFRKTGRPLERELELVPREIVREHRFEDETSVALPGGSKGAQFDAVEALGPGLGQQWVDYVSSFADDWEMVRKEYLERPWRPEVADKSVVSTIFTRDTVAKRLKKTFKDERLRLMAAHPFVIDGHDPRNVPAWMGTTAYLEQGFGVWQVVGGMGLLTQALEERLATRGVTVHRETEVKDLVVREGHVVAVATDRGQLDADLVVCAVDPRRLPALASYVISTMPALPPVICHLGLTGDVPEDLPPEIVFHGDPMLVLRTDGRAPEGAHAWSVYGRGKLAEDMVLALARKGINIRASVDVRVDRSPREQVETWGGSPMGVLWQGRDTIRRRLGPTTPIKGVYAAGAHATPGAGLPFVGLSAALVAQEIGPA
jgi:phytoene dehydrogenase-like protein